MGRQRAIFILMTLAQRKLPGHMSRGHAVTDSNVSVELWPLKTVLAKTGMSRSYIYREMKTGGFPGQVLVGRSARWTSIDVQQWIDVQIARSKQRSG